MSMQQVRRPVGARLFWAAIMAGCAGAFVGLYHWAVRTASGQQIDITMFARMQSPDDAIHDVASVLRWLLPTLLAVPYLALVVIALRERRVARVVSTVLLGAVSLGLARFLRLDLLTRPDLGDHGYMYNTYPSGHVAATTALAIAVLLLTGIRRTVVVIAAIVIALACGSSVIGHAHRPSDALGAVLLVATLTAVGLAARPYATRTNARSGAAGQ
jgi:membrane-associated phospholipid phosphatase